ncbi:hypothetical protein FKP32DRAFT_324689 [Trametes sanguinea]|nr:hypothetical protein FKP32DRAFT_324689 [Trametes sanguinea]
MHLGGRSWEEELSYLTFNASANFRPHSASHLAAVLGARRDSDEKSTSTIRSSTSGTLKSVRGTTSQARHLGLSTQQPEKTTAFSSFTQPSLAGFESQSAADPALQSLLNSIIQQATALSTALPVGAQPTEASSKSTEPSSPTSTSVDPRFAPTGSSASQPNGQKRSLLPLIAIPGALLVFLAIFLGVWRRKRRARPRRVVQAEAPSPLSVRQEITIGDTISTRRSIFWRTTGGRPTAREMKEADTSDRGEYPFVRHAF